MADNEVFDYAKAREELNEVLDWFESGEIDVEMAIKQHARAEELIKQIESYLKDVEKNLKINIRNKE